MSKKRSAAQIAATKRMLAANRARRSASKPAKKTASAKRPRRASAPASKTTTVVVRQAAAPVPAKKPSRARAAASRARAAAGKGLKLGKEILDDVLIPAGVGAGSASAVDVVYGYARKWLPEKIANSPAKHAIKAGAGIGLAMIAQKMGVPPKHAKAGAIGVCTVAAHRLLNEQIEKKVSVNLNGMAMTMGELSAVIPVDEDLNGLEALGALAAGDAELGAVLPFLQQSAA